jgi:hypothetical protein
MKLLLCVYIPEIRRFIPVQVQGDSFLDFCRAQAQLRLQGRCTAMVHAS